MSTVGRNDPCHCGSGKKYKKCHMEQDEQRGRELRGLSNVEDWLGFHLRRLHEAARPLADGQAAIVAAAEGFFAGADRPAHPLDDTLFRDHAYFDVAVDAEGGTVGASLALAPELPSLTDTASLQKALTVSYLSLLEVTEVKRGKGLGVRDCLTGTEAFVWDEPLSAELDPMEVVLGRRLAFTDRPLLVPGWRRLYFHGRRKAIAAARTELEASGCTTGEPAALLQWLKAAAPRLVALARAHDRPA